MINIHRIDEAITDCLTEIGEEHAEYIVLINAPGRLAVGANIEDTSRVRKLLETALEVVNRPPQTRIRQCEGTA